MITFSEFIKEYQLKNKATSNLKIQQVLSSLSLDGVGIYLRDGNLHPSKGTHLVCYINENYFDSNVCLPRKKLSKFIIKRNGYCLYLEYQIQKYDGFCAIYCLYIIYRQKMLVLILNLLF